MLIIVTLAIGLGATLAMVSAIHGVLLEPLPYPQPDRIVAIGETERPDDFGTTGFTTFDDWKRSLRSFDSIAAATVRRYTLTGHGDPEILEGLAVSHDLFETLGVRPLLGREYDPADATRNAPARVVISEELWRRRFDADRSILGKSITFGETPFEVVGVMPERTRLRETEWRGQRVDVWVPLRYDTSLTYACRSCRHIRVFGRLRDGVTIDSAARELETFTAGLRHAYPEMYPSHGFTYVTSLRETVVGRRVSGSLWIVFVVAAFVLLAALANASSLRLSEIFARRNEIAVRLSLGATPRRVAAMLIRESVAQSLVAGILALGLAYAGILWLRANAVEFVPRASDLRLHPGLVAGGIALSLLCGAVIGLLPAIRSLAWSRMAGRGVIAHRWGAQQLLVAVNVAVAVALLAGTALLLRSVWTLFSTPPGLDATDVVSLRLSPSGARYDDSAALYGLYERYLTEAAATSGTESVALTSQLPFAENDDNAGMNAEDQIGRRGDAPDAQRFAVTSQYFDTLRIPVLEGRPFNREDVAGSEPVIVLSTSAARILWPQGSAIGRRVQLGGGADNPFRRVVGVVGDVAPGDIAARRVAQAYVPLSQYVAGEVTAVARTTGGAQQLREAMRRVDPSTAVFRLSSLNTLIRQSEGRRTFVLACLGLFALITVLVGMIGLYGMLSVLVRTRMREFALRVALGATVRNVVAMVFSTGMRVVAVALAAGIAVTLLLGRFLDGLLYGVRSHDPVVLTAVTALVVLGAAAACALPAWRAATVAPNVVLHEE